MNNSEIQIFTTKDGKTEVEVKLDNETVWLNQYQLESLFGYPVAERGKGSRN